MALTMKNEAYHRKQMEYYQEEIRILKEENRERVGKPRHFRPFKDNSKLDDRHCEAKCQSCGEKVIILKNHPYFGILCSKCMKGGKVYST